MYGVSPLAPQANYPGPCLKKAGMVSSLSYPHNWVLIAYFFPPCVSDTILAQNDNSTVLESHFYSSMLGFFWTLHQYFLHWIDSGTVQFLLSFVEYPSRLLACCETVVLNDKRANELLWPKISLWLIILIPKVNYCVLRHHRLSKSGKRHWLPGLLWLFLALAIHTWTVLRGRDCLADDEDNQ